MGEAPALWNLFVHQVASLNVRFDPEDRFFFLDDRGNNKNQAYFKRFIREKQSNRVSGGPSKLKGSLSGCLFSG